MLVLKKLPDLLLQRCAQGRPPRISPVPRFRVWGPVCRTFFCVLTGWDLEVAEAFVHSWWAAEEYSYVFICRVDARKGCFAQFFEEWWESSFYFDVLMVS